MTLTRRGWLALAAAVAIAAVLVCWAMWDVLAQPGINGAESLLILLGVATVAVMAVTEP